jgi:anti-sigma factor RsiW
LVRESVRAASVQYAAPAALRDAVKRRLASSSGVPSPHPRTDYWAWVRWPVLNFGLGAALAASVMFFVLTPGNDGLADQVLASHVRALQPGHLEDVVSTDQHTVKPWFDGRIDFAPPVKNLAAQGFPLDGGRLDYLNGRPVAAMVYVHGKHPINLYVWPSPGVPDTAPSERTRNGYNLTHFVQNEMTVWVISDLERGQLAEFVRLWQGG